VFVTDTGNKRVVVYDQDGNYITEFGGLGTALGQLDEPVGIAVADDGRVYVADTWNQRIQVFVPDSSGTVYSSVDSWSVTSWESTSTENKPFLALDNKGHVFVTDPEKYRVLEFSADGTFLRGWGQYSPQTDGFGLPSGIAVDKAGGIWVSDAANNDLLHFTLPALPVETRSLPKNPPGAEALILDTTNGTLVDKTGQVIYQLDRINWVWVPYIPAEILAALPPHSTPAAEQATSWILLDSEQIARFLWDPINLQWLIIPQVEPTSTATQ